MFNRKSGFILIIAWILLLPFTASAQTSAGAVIFPPDISEFPQISTFLEVFDGSGNFIHDLTIENVFIIEDQNTIPVSQIEEFETGAQFVVAINLGPTFAIRDVNGVSRYQQLLEALTNWATQHDYSQDDLSFLTNDGPEHIHLEDAQELLDGVLNYQSDPREAVPSLDVLGQAINVAADPTRETGMGRAILLVTPSPDRAGIAALQSLAALAKLERVRVYVWMVSSPAYFTSEGANQLADLAFQTGGRFFAFSGDESIPEIANYLTPLRHVYAVEYESQIRSDSPHQIAAQIQYGNLTITSDDQNFELQVLPPNPIFITPPQKIIRANTSSLDVAITEETEFTPKEQIIEALIEFPDGRPRSLVRTALYVDGNIVDEKTSPPFDQFVWDLRDYNRSGEFVLLIEAVDSYGLSNISIPTSIQVTVQQTPQSVVATIAQNSRLIGGSVVALAGAILILVLIRGGRIRPKFGRANELNGQENKTEKSEQVKQPVPLNPLPTRRRISRFMNRFSWSPRQSASKPVAFLVALTNQNSSPDEDRIPIIAGETTFGKDERLATIILNDPSLEGLHARLRVDGSNKPVLVDEASTAGTWVNYESIARDGTKLEHGDIIHIGRVGLRFLMNDKEMIPNIKVTQQEHLL